MADLLFEDELNMLLEQCKTMVNTDSYVVDQYTKERDNEFELAEESGVDLGPYSNDEYNGFQLHEIRLGLEHRVNVKLYDDIAFSWEQMREIRKGLEHGLNASAYADSLYSDSQMHEIRMGLECGIDVSSYAKLVYSKSDMSRMRSELFEAKYMEYSKGFARKYTDDETGAVIRLGDDLMEAFLTVPKDKSFTEAMIYNILEDNGVTYGYIAENITALAEKGSEAGEMQVAQGVQFEKGSDGSYKMLWRKFEPPTPYVRADGTMDFATVDFVDMVKAGQPIAIYTPAKKGQDGMTVTGFGINNSAGEDLPKLNGKDIMLRSDKVTYAAKKDGYVVFDEDKYTIDIQDVLIIDGSVNYLYGNVFYDGTVRVKGNVEDGTIINAKGDVIVEGYVQSAYISAGNKVLVIGGVNANDSGYIAAQAGVYADYLENAIVYAGENVEANYILNSEVEAGTEISIKGAKGMICGGKVAAGFKVSAQYLGHRNLTKTKVCVGMNMRATERLNAANSLRIGIERDLNTLRMGEQHIIQTVPEKMLASNEMYRKLGIAIRMKEEEWEKSKAEIEEIQKWLDQTDKVSINVYSTVYPNTDIYINDCERLIEDEMFNVSFYQANDTIFTRQCRK